MVAFTLILCTLGLSAKDVTLSGFTYTADGGPKENKKIQVTYALNSTDKIARVKKVVDNNFPQKKSCEIPRTIKVDGVTYKVTKIGAKAFAQAGSNGNMNDANGKPLYNDLSFTRIKLPNTIVEIGDEAFCYLSSLKEFTLPTKVEKIGKHAFNHGGSFKSLTVPATCVSIGECAFGYCCIETLSFANGSKPLTLGRAVFIHNDIKTLVTPHRLAKWGDSMFWCNYRLTDVTVNGSVSNISESCFSSCNSLARVTINAPIASIDEQAFFDCYALSSLKVASANTLRSIGENAFQNCSFTTLGPDVLPYGLTTIGKSAFHSCKALTSVEFPVTLTRVCDNAFTSCKAIARIKCLTPIVPVAEWPAFPISIFPTCDVEVLPALAAQFSVAPVWEYFDWSKYTEASVADVGLGDGDTLPVEYYNLNGIRVDVDALVPGVYIERSGSGSRKVIVR